MSKKVYPFLALLILAAMVLSACATPAAPTTAPQATTAPQPTEEAKPKLKIGLVTDTGGVNDKSFNQSAWAGVQKAAQEFGLDAKYHRIQAAHRL